METTPDVLICKLCNKEYKNKSGLWKHNNKKHPNNISPKSSESNPTVIQKSSESNPIINCRYCSKFFKYKQGKWKHEQKCDKKNSPDKIIQGLQDKMEELQLQLSSVLKHAKIHPKTLQKINKNLINGNNNNNTINNGTINNIQLVKFGSEDFSSILTEKEIKKILSYRFKALEESIRYVHFNDAKPEYRNIYITNLRDNLAYVYNGNRFEAVPKHSVISELIDQHITNIEVSLEDYKHKLPERTVSILDKLIEKLQDNETKMFDEVNNKEYKNYKLYKMNEVKLMIYNKTGNNTEVIKLKYNLPIQNE